MPSPVTTNVLVGLATLYTGAANSDVLPANSVALGGSWGGTWVYSGGTDSGVSLTVAQNTVDVTIEEQPTPVDVLVDTMDISVGVTLAEDTLENMKIAWGGTLTVNAGATPPNKVLAFSALANKLAVGFEGINPYGKARRVFLPNCVSITTTEAAYRRTQAKRMYNVRFRYIGPIGSATITEITG